jgi:hypothetical protein
MTPEERRRMDWLCLRIQEEKDPKTFDQLVHELNELLEIKHERIHPNTNPSRIKIHQPSVRTLPPGSRRNQGNCTQ